MPARSWILVTADGACKWSPCFDAAGRRIAFCEADGGGEGRFLHNDRLCVLDLVTGETRRFAPSATSGSPSKVVWSQEETTLIYDWMSEGRSHLFETTVGPPATVPPQGAENTKDLFRPMK